MATRYCEKCRKTMTETNFYQYKNGEKCELCKSCLTMHIDNFDPDTFTWLLEKFDVPYIEAEWNVLRDRAYEKDPYKMTGLTVFGKYLSKMKLNQWKKYTWADTERLKAEAELRAKAAGAPNVEELKQEFEIIKQKFQDGEISEAEYRTYAEIIPPEGGASTFYGDHPAKKYTGDPKVDFSTDDDKAPSQNNFYPINGVFEQVELEDPGTSLTTDDKIYLAMKWGRLYSAGDWVWLEKKYNNFMSSFDIQGEARIDTLVFICKTSLKMNQALDAGDIDTYQKLAKTYDAQMKAAKFTEAQNKDEHNSDFDCVGSLVAFCEKEGGFIPRFYIDTPNDKADLVLEDNKNYLRRLVENDPTISQKIEQYLQKKQNFADIEADKENGKTELTDEDIEEFVNYKNQER